MNQTITNAIRERRLLRITYKGESREVEPHIYGRQTSGKDALSAWQRSGGSGVGFRLFHLADLSACADLALSFPWRPRRLQPRRQTVRGRVRSALSPPGTVRRQCRWPSAGG